MSAGPPEPAHPELQSLLDATVDAVILIDARGTIETFNRAGERLFGYAADEVIGCNVNILMTAVDRDAHDGYMARYLRTSVPHIIGIGREVDARRKDGSVFPVFLSVGRVQGSDPPRFIGLLHDITLRREAMTAIRRERDRANMYLEIAQVILVALSPDHRVQLINRKGCDTLGRRELDLLGRNWLEVAVAPAQHALVSGQFDALGAAEGSDERYFEHEVRDADGRRRLVAWRAIAMRSAEGRLTGFFASGEDITGRRVMEQAMERAKVLLDEAQELAGLGNFEVFHPADGGGFWSPQMTRILGLPAQATASLQAYIDAVHPEDRAVHAEAWRDAVRGPGTRGAQFRIGTPAGETRHLQATYVTGPGPRGDLRIAGVVMDVTAARRAAEEAQAAQQRMTQVSRLATMGEMAAGIAHELNQPLAAIANYANAALRLTASADLSQSDPEGDVRDALDQISRQALRAGEIIRRLRALVQNRETRLEPSAINALVGEVVGFIRGDARLNEVEVVLDLCADLPIVMLDRIQVQQILLNLLRNAIESTVDSRPAGREVRVVTARGEDALLVEVSDNGAGVPPELVARIFDPFCTTKESGTGLGLAISRTIAEAHHGRLSYAPVPQGGARFILQLPDRTRRPE
jgi:two-component system sensor kinase FixL